MEFWGVEVQAGKKFQVTPEEGTLIHVSHASLGDCKGRKGETVTLNVKVGDKKFVLGTLVSDRIPQTLFDVIFDKEFELSHNWGKGSVYLVGFKCPNDKVDEGEYFSDSEEEEEEQVPATVTANGNAAKAVAKPKAAPAQVKKNAEPEADDSGSDSEGMDVDEDDSDDEDDSEEDETPKAETRKKRANEAAPKTPVSAKKAKVDVTPKKTEGKKTGGHTATPHPAKKGGKTPTTATQSPKSASQVSCGSCKKTFNSTNALDSHSKAKHSATAK